MNPNQGMSRKVTSVLFTVILLAIAAQLVLNVVSPYIPVVMGLLCFITITGYFWRRMRRW